MRRDHNRMRHHCLKLSGLHFAICICLLSGCSGKPAAPKGPDRPKAAAHLQEAERLAKEKKHKEALAEAQRARETDPTLADAYFLRAQLFEQSGHFREKQEELLAAVKANPDDYEVMMRLLYATQAHFPPAEAEAIARKALAKQPDSAEAHYFIGLAIVNGGDPSRRKEALQSFETSNRLNSGATMPLTEMGKLLLQMGETVRALAVLESDAMLLDAGKPRGPVPIPIVEDWLTQRRTVAFWTADALRRLGRKAEERNAAALAEKLSAQSSELRKLKSLAFENPPDPAAKKRLQEIMNGRF